MPNTTANHAQTAPAQLTINLLRTTLAIITRRLPIRPFLACAAIRTLLRVFTPRQLQFLMPPTIPTYQSFIRKTRSRARRAGDVDLMEQLREDIEVLPDGASHLLWIGDRHRATKIVFFFHGGGYMAPALPGHMEWALQAYVLAPRRAADKSSSGGIGAGDKVAVAFLQYTLTPGARYPTQLCQAAAGLNVLLRRGVSPGQIVVGGDSAGGNLTVQLLSHLLHPHPDAEVVDLSAGPLAGAFLVSPLVTDDLSSQSFRDGLPCDMLSPEIFRDPTREMFHEPKGGLSGWFFPNSGLVETEAYKRAKPWALLRGVGDDWFDGMSRVVDKVYVTAGKHELLRDQGIKLAETIRKRNDDVDVKLEVPEKEAHDFILLEGEKRDVGDATTRMRDWFLHVW